MSQNLLILNTFWLTENLSESQVLGIVESKLLLKTSNFLPVLRFFFLMMRIRNLQCSTLYWKCDQAYNLLQQWELASVLESDLRDTADWGRKWLGDSNVTFLHFICLFFVVWWLSSTEDCDLNSNNGNLPINKFVIYSLKLLQGFF